MILLGLSLSLTKALRGGDPCGPEYWSEVVAEQDCDYDDDEGVYECTGPGWNCTIGYRRGLYEIGCQGFSERCEVTANWTWFKEGPSAEGCECSGACRFRPSGGLIALLAVGGGCVVAAVLCVVWVCCRRRARLAATPDPAPGDAVYATSLVAYESAPPPFADVRKAPDGDATALPPAPYGYGYPTALPTAPYGDAYPTALPPAPYGDAYQTALPPAPYGYGYPPDAAGQAPPGSADHPYGGPFVPKG
jgi:hypothetical protein